LDGRLRHELGPRLGRPTRPRRVRPLKRLVHPLPIAAAIVLAVNDFVLKGLAPGVLTGKLSDLAGLFLAPLLVAALLETRIPIRRSMPWIGFACAIVFSAAKTLPTWLGLSAPWVVDPTDLVAVGVLPLAWLHARGGAGEVFARRPRARVALFACIAAATIATPQAQGVRRFPAWETEQPSHVVGGAIVQAWVSRSTREGIGVSVDVACAPGATRPVSIDASRTFLRIAGERLRPVEVAPASAIPGAHVRGYLAFEFDNRRAWNDGVRTATLRLAVRVDGGLREIPISIVETRPDPHGRPPQEIER
jgi:hypothetical protein